MAGIIRALALLLTLHLCITEETPFSVSIACPGAPQVALTERINAFLRRIPNNPTLPHFLQGHRVVDMDIGYPTLTGLGVLWAYRQYTSACFSQKTTHVEVTAFARVPLVAQVSWNGYTGGSGHMGIQVSSSQLRLVFTSAPTSDDPAHLELSRIYPVSLEDAQAFISGAPEVPTKIVNYASVVLKHQIEEFSSFLLRWDAQHLIRDRRHGV